MLQLVYPRDSRFVIPDANYEQFYADPHYMEPAAKGQSQFRQIS
jgi:hypothetical protein